MGRAMIMAYLRSSNTSMITRSDVETLECQGKKRLVPGSLPVLDSLKRLWDDEVLR